MHLHYTMTYIAPPLKNIGNAKITPKNNQITIIHQAIYFQYINTHTQILKNNELFVIRTEKPIETRATSFQ